MRKLFYFILILGTPLLEAMEAPAKKQVLLERTLTRTVSVGPSLKDLCFKKITDSLCEYLDDARDITQLLLSVPDDGIRFKILEALYSFLDTGDDTKEDSNNRFANLLKNTHNLVENLDQSNKQKIAYLALVHFIAFYNMGEFKEDYFYPNLEILMQIIRQLPTDTIYAILNNLCQELPNLRVPMSDIDVVVLPIMHEIISWFDLNGRGKDITNWVFSYQRHLTNKPLVLEYANAITIDDPRAKSNEETLGILIRYASQEQIQKILASAYRDTNSKASIIHIIEACRGRYEKELKKLEEENKVLKQKPN